MLGESCTCNKNQGIMIYEKLFLIDYCFLARLLTLFAIYRDGQFLLVGEDQSRKQLPHTNFEITTSVLTDYVYSRYNTQIIRVPRPNSTSVIVVHILITYRADFREIAFIIKSSVPMQIDVLLQGTCKQGMTDKIIKI